MKNTVVSLMRALLLSLMVAPAALALDTGDILVVSAKGEVRVTMNGTVTPVRAGSVLVLPASVSTGPDGSIELRQGATTVSVGPNTLLDFPALERRGGSIDRIQQPRGNAFYSIGKRDGHKLRVETPYLVGVVKGTQFNVSAREDGTTISLFEGLLEVRAADESAVVDLRAGELASRRQGDKGITVMRMDSGKLPTSAPRPQADNDNDGGNGRDASSPADGVSGNAGSSSGVVAVTEPLGRPVITGNVGADVRGPGAVVDGDAGVSLAGGNAAVNVTANAALGETVGASNSVVVSANNNGVTADVSTGTNVNVASVGADVSASTNVDVSGAGASVQHSTDVAVSAGPVAVDVSVNTAIDAGPGGANVDVATNTAVGTGSTSIDAGSSLGVDLGPRGATVDVSTNTSVDAGAVSTTVDTSTAVDVGAGSLAVDTPATVSVAGTDVSAGVSAGVDVSSGAVDLGVSVAGTDLGLGVDLGLGNSEPATDTGSSTTTATDTGNTGTTDVGGLLDGLLRRPGRR